MKSDFVKKLIKEDILYDCKTTFRLSHEYKTNQSKYFYLIKNPEKLSLTLKEKHSDKFFLIDLYFNASKHVRDNSSLFYNGEDTFIFSFYNWRISKTEIPSHLFFWKGDHWEVVYGTSPNINERFSNNFKKLFTFNIDKFRINITRHMKSYDHNYYEAFKDLQYYWNADGSYSFDDKNLFWQSGGLDIDKLLIIDQEVFQRYRLYYAQEFIKIEDSSFYWFWQSSGLCAKQGFLISLLSKIEPEVIKAAIAKKEFINQKEDFKKYLDFNCDLNFNKLTYAQILLIYVLKQRFNSFGFNHKVWKRIINLIKEGQKRYEDENDYSHFSRLLAKTPVTEPTNEFEKIWLANWNLDIIWFIFENYLNSKKLTNFMIKDVEDIITMRYEIKKRFNYDFYFEFFHNIFTVRNRKKYIKTVHDKIVYELNAEKAKVAASASTALNVVDNLLLENNNIKFIPIKNTYELFLLGEEFHNCVYSRKHKVDSVFYKVLYKNKKYCLECTNKYFEWELYEIKGVCNQYVEDNMVLNEIKKQLEKYNKHLQT